MHEKVIRKWVKTFENDPLEACPWHGRMKVAKAVIERLRRETQKPRTVRNKKYRSLFRTNNAVRGSA